MTGQVNAWAVILAGGEGTRLQCLTTRIEGDERPKQFCRILGEESLLTQTRHRIKPRFDPGKIITVVSKKHEPYYSREFDDRSRRALVEQPEDRGTGVAVAAAILMLRELDPAAIVALLPCDHHYYREGAFLDVLDAGIGVANDNSDAIVLIGAEPTCPETEYGWIEPGQKLASNSSFAPARVSHFWEKPTLATAQELQRRGCLWNTFVTVGSANAFIDVFCQAAPNAMLTLSAGTMDHDLDSAYGRIPSIDFSRDVLASQPERLLVIRDAFSGWTDLGNPKRVLDTLAREGIAPAWLTAGHGIAVQ
jgi:mannose-1-phosphate guanylyltransferase